MKQIKLLSILFIILSLFFLYGITFYPHSGVLPSGGSLEAPSTEHILGTDNLGIDIYAQISRGFFRSMAIGLLAALLSFVLGGVLGVFAGYCGAKTDGIVSFLINVFLSVPQLPIMIVIGAFFGQSTLNIIVLISAFSWAQIAKQMRAKTMTIKNSVYVTLAKSYGAGTWYVIRKHMLRELLPLLGINSLAVIGRAIIQESSLAYLGLSDPLEKSWGLLIQKATDFPGIYFTDYWKWWLLPPVLSLIGSVLILRLLAKALESYYLEKV